MLVFWYATMTFIHLKSFLHILAYLDVVSVSSMELPGFSEIFSDHFNIY